MTRRRTVVKEQASLSPDKKIVGLQIFLAGPVTRDLDREPDINLAAEQALFFLKKTRPRGTLIAVAIMKTIGKLRKEEWGGKAKFSLPAPPPYCDPLTLESFLDSAQLSVSFSVQIVRTAKYACFAC